MSYGNRSVALSSGDVSISTLMDVPEAITVSLLQLSKKLAQRLAVIGGEHHLDSRNR